MTYAILTVWSCRRRRPSEHVTIQDKLIHNLWSDVIRTLSCEYGVVTKQVTCTSFIDTSSFRPVGCHYTLAFCMHMYSQRAGETVMSTVVFSNKKG